MTKPADLRYDAALALLILKAAPSKLGSAITSSPSDRRAGLTILAGDLRQVLRAIEQEIGSNPGPVCNHGVRLNEICRQCDPTVHISPSV